MAKISFDTYSENVSVGFDNQSSNVGYFNLKNDGDQAIVRFLHDSTDDFDIITTHPIEIDGKYRRVNCLRTPNDSMDKCPMCSSGQKIQNRIYIRLIHYVKDENGNVVPKPEIWERSMAYAATLKNMIDEYGPLSDCIFKVKRRGAPRQMDTKYDIMFGNPKVYPEELYPKCLDAFKGFEVLGRMCLNKSFDELSNFVKFGKFDNDDVNISVPEIKSKNEQITGTPWNETHPVTNGMPWENSTVSPISKPIRTY